MCLTIDAYEGSVSRPCDSAPAQDFVLPEGAPGPIRLGDQCLAPRGGGYYPPLFAEACTGAPAQIWEIAENGAIVNGDGRCLAVLGLVSRDGTRVYASECPDREYAQTWRALANNQYDYEPLLGRIRWQSDSTLCLTWIQQGSFIGLAMCGDRSAGEQIFSFDRAHMGQFRARSACMRSAAAFGGIRLGDCYVDPSATWMLMDGAMLFNGNGHCVEPRQENGRWIARMNNCTASTEQRWQFEAATD